MMQEVYMAPKNWLEFEKMKQAVLVFSRISFAEAVSQSSLTFYLKRTWWDNL